MFSPAACYPVATNGRVFIVAPDRYMTSFNALTGEVLWRKKVPAIRVRESMGLSADSALVYLKTMDGQLMGISTKADSMQVAWRSSIQLPYELDPSAIVEDNGIIYVPSHSGTIYAVKRKDGNLLWKYKLSNSLINPVLPAGANIFLSAMDGKVACLQYLKAKKLKNND